MPGSFPHTQGALHADGRGAGLAALLLIGAVLLGWAAWFRLTPVAVYAITDKARLETDRAAHPIDALIPGRVVAVHMTLGAEVREGDTLVELDATAERLALSEERARLAAYSSQLLALRKELEAEKAARAEDVVARRAALEETRARQREGEALAGLAADEARRASRLHSSGSLPEQALVRARAEEERRRTAASALRIAVDRVEWERRSALSDRRARVSQIERSIALLEGSSATATAAIERLEHEVERRRILAPISGHLGEVARLYPGAVVKEGDRLGLVVPPGSLRIVADFAPEEAIGRVRPGQSARLRLDGFPWTQYGSIAATVVHVGNEVREGRVQVELQPSPAGTSRAPLQHGLTGTVEVTVERLTPATLVLRAAGQRLGPARFPERAVRPGGPN